MRKRQHVLTTTTASIPGYDVVGYAGVVTAHVVAGTGVFSDIAGSFTDVFGGRSRSYQKQLEAIDSEVIAQLQQKAEKLGGNAVIGLRVDHDEVSGGGKQMFMVTASGTAVRVEQSATERVRTNGKSDQFDAEEITRRQTRRYLIEMANQDRLGLNEENWTFITRHGVHEVAPAVLRHAVRRLENTPTYEEPDLRRHEDYLRRLPRETAIDLLYPLSVHEHPQVRKFTRGLLLEMELLEFDRIESLLRSEEPVVRRRALWLLNLHKPAYDLSDTDALERMASVVEECFPNLWVESQKSTFTGKEKTVATCACGHKHSADVSHCPTCGRDRQGFLREEKKPDAYANSLRWRKQAIEEAASETSAMG